MFSLPDTVPAHPNITQISTTTLPGFVQSFEAAWAKLMNADRFDGPTGSPCGGDAAAAAAAAASGGAASAIGGAATTPVTAVVA